jgi:hypothetical protein
VWGQENTTDIVEKAKEIRANKKGEVVKGTKQILEYENRFAFL